VTEQIVTASSLVRDLSTRFEEPEWVRGVREQAWTFYQQAPVPRLEKTDLRKRGWEFGPFPTDVSAVIPEAQEYFNKAEGPAVLVVDGIVKEFKIPGDLKEKGIVFTDIHTALREHGELAKQYFGSIVYPDENKWIALNTAMFHGGIFLYVPKGVKIEIPFELVYSDSEHGKGSFSRTLIVGQELSDFSFGEVRFMADNIASGIVHSHVLEVFAKPDSRIKLGVVDELRKGPTNYVTRRAEVAKDALVEWVSGEVGDGFTVEVLESIMAEPGSRSTTRHVGLGFGRQRLDMTTNMVHKGRYSESDITMHGIIRDKAYSLYRSRTHIVKGAVMAGSEQNDRMIVLDKSSRADAIPMLLIDENDVERCGHAASVGKVDPNQIYYLMSRGIPELKALEMIIWGYLQGTVSSLPNESAQRVLTSRIERELNR
jgi:Fe-S cluster assembly protein SufD